MLYIILKTTRAIYTYSGGFDALMSCLGVMSKFAIKGLVMPLIFF